MLESEYQKKLIDKLRTIFPGCLILKNDAEYLPGIPDLSIFYGARWAMLEVKASAKSKYRPNQEYYLAKANGMSFASVIYPSIEEDVLSALSAAFQGV
ncbi:VRR-Nuc domain protein [Streptomyces phage ClubPenguin]|nr:VRR-Nuc domain protein [Streptomyces phage ClubPenguin]